MVRALSLQLHHPLLMCPPVTPNLFLCKHARQTFTPQSLRKCCFLYLEGPSGFGLMSLSLGIFPKPHYRQLVVSSTEHPKTFVHNSVIALSFHYLIIIFSSTKVPIPSPWPKRGLRQFLEYNRCSKETNINTKTHDIDWQRVSCELHILEMNFSTIFFLTEKEEKNDNKRNIKKRKTTDNLLLFHFLLILFILRPHIVKLYMLLSQGKSCCMNLRTQ